MDHSKQITILSFAVAVLFVSVLFLLYLNFYKTPTLISTPQTGIIPTASPSESPPADPTADWKTYQNTQFNYQINYPKEWTIQVKGNENPSTANGPILQSPCNYQSGDVCSSMQIDVQQPDGTSKTLDDYANSLVNSSPTVRPDQLISKKHLTVNGQDAIEIEKYEDNYYYSSTDHGVVVISIVTLKNNKIYYFTLLERRQNQSTIKTSSDWKNKDIYYQLLSTFKFTNITTNTNKLETYTNINYGFQLSYPSNWKRINLSPESTEFTIQSPQGELIHVTPFNNVNYDNSKDSSTVKNIQLKNGKTLLLTYVECDGEGCGFGKLELNTFSEIISSIKLL